MSEQAQENSIVLRTALRNDVVDVWGDKTDTILKACQAHMLDAVSTVLTIHQRFHCLQCKHTALIMDFFPWLNEEGYVYVINGEWDYPEFIAHVTRWAQGWAEEQMLSPCTDGMPSAELH
jgi:hypothetical protein